MKIKLVALRKNTMRSLVMQSESGEVFCWKKIGEVQEVTDPKFAYKILSDCPDMLEDVTLNFKKPSARARTNAKNEGVKTASSPENKMMDSPSVK